MNQLTGAEALVRMLSLFGVEHVFGLCGDTSLPIYDALYRLDHNITHILTRDERSAGYMANVYARLTGRIGVCEGPSGGGATYIAPALAEANESSIPVLALNSDISVASRGRYPLTELDQQALFRPLTKWNTVIELSGRVPATLRQAMTAMTTGRPGAAHVGLPIDVQRGPVDDDEIWARETGASYLRHPVAPHPDDVEAVAGHLRQAKRPVIICGGGPVNARAFDELAELAGRLGAIVATSVSGKGAISELHPLAAGVVGSNGGTIETRELVDMADVVFLVGCRAGSVTTEKWQHPAIGSCKVLHLDVDPMVVGANYPVAAAIVGDARLGLRALCECLRDHRHETKGEAERAVADARRRKFARFGELAASDARPIRPERIVATLTRLLPQDAILIADPGTPCPYFSAYWPMRSAGRSFISNRAHGALGYALPGVVGAAVAMPDRKCVAVIGDGSFGFCVGELETIVRLDLPVTIIVISNDVFGWIKAGQKASFGGRYYSVDFTRTDHARVAAAYGLKTWQVEAPAELESVLASALTADGPNSRRHHHPTIERRGSSCLGVDCLKRAGDARRGAGDKAETNRKVSGHLHDSNTGRFAAPDSDGGAATAAVDVRIVNVTRYFGEVAAVRNVSLSIQRGEFFSLLGPSGCGKTTTLRIIGGFEEPDSGEVYLQEKRINGVAPHRRNTNMVFQQLALFPHLTVAENIAFGLRLKGASRADVERKVHDALSLVSLEGYEQRAIHQLSGGQQQRVAIARALVNEPAVLLLDEPLGALDVQLRAQLQTELKAIQRRLGTTFIFVTHDQNEAFAMSDRLALMNAGEIEQIGTPRELYDQPATRFVATFVGDTNIFDGRILDIGADGVATVAADGLRFSAVAPGKKSGDPLCCSVRPEHIVLEAHSSAENGNTGNVRSIVFQGAIVKLIVEVAGGRTVEVQALNQGKAAAVALGDAVVMHWPETMVVVLSK